MHTGKYGISLSKGLLKAIEEGDILDAATVRAILAHELSHVYYGSFDWARFWNVIDEINNACAKLMFFPFVGMLLTAGIGSFITVFSLTHVLFLCAGIAFSFLVFTENYFFAQNRERKSLELI
ncbi:MAG: Wss1p-related putative metallopeptidase [Candidatus Berkiella sp.]